MTGRGAVAAMPRLMLLVAVLLGLGLTYAGAHLCGPSSSMACMHSDASAGPAEMNSVMPVGTGAGMLSAAAVGPGVGMAAHAGSDFGANTANAGDGMVVSSGVVAHEDSGQDGSFMLCLAALVGILAAVVVLVLRLGRMPVEMAPRSGRPGRSPEVRGPPRFGLMVRQVMVLQV